MQSGGGRNLRMRRPSSDPNPRWGTQIGGARRRGGHDRFDFGESPYRSEGTAVPETEASANVIDHVSDSWSCVRA